MFSLVLFFRDGYDGLRMLFFRFLILILVKFLAVKLQFSIVPSAFQSGNGNTEM